VARILAERMFGNVNDKQAERSHRPAVPGPWPDAGDARLRLPSLRQARRYPQRSSAL